MTTCTCGGKTHILQTRQSAKGIIRRRECVSCGKRFNTLEARYLGPTKPKTDKSRLDAIRSKRAEYVAHRDSL